MIHGKGVILYCTSGDNAKLLLYFTKEIASIEGEKVIDDILLYDEHFMLDSN